MKAIDKLLSKITSLLCCCRTVFYEFCIGACYWVRFKVHGKYVFKTSYYFE